MATKKVDPKFQPKRKVNNGKTGWAAPRIRQTSRKHVLLRERPRGQWYPDLVGVVKGYPKTYESWKKRSDLMKARLAQYKAEGRPISRRGVPDGYAGRKEEVQAFRAKAAEFAEKVVPIMAEQSNITDPRAISAMKEAVEIFEARDEKGTPINKSQERIAAIRTVLEYTTAKPAQKQDINVSKAEDWLAALAASK